MSRSFEQYRTFYECDFYRLNILVGTEIELCTQYNRASQKIVRETFLANLYKCPSKSEGFYFSNLPLSDIVKELEYYFDTRIIILDQKLSDNTYIAYFTNGETLDEILSNLNTDGQMSITRSQEVIMITSATP